MWNGREQGSSGDWQQPRQTPMRSPTRRRVGIAIAGCLALSCIAAGALVLRGSGWTPPHFQSQNSAAQVPQTATGASTATTGSQPTATPRPAATPSPTPGPGPTPTPGSLAISVSGNHLVNASGQTVVLRGVNRSGTEYACIQGWGIFDGPADAASVQAIASWNTNIVRVLLNEDCWLGINGVPSQDSGANYRTAIEQYVNLLHQYGLYTEISLIWVAPGTLQATGQLPLPDADHSPAAWSSIASAFKNDPDVIFGVYGEPHYVTWSCWLNGGSACNGQTSYMAAGMQTLVNTIRATGATQPVTVSCLHWANTCDGWLSNHPTDPARQLVAEFHQYGNNACHDTSCWQTGIWAVQNAGFPVMTGELGETYDDSSCGSTFVQTYTSMADGRGISYMAWTWDTWGTCTTLISNYNGTPYSFGVFYRQHLLSLGH
jgi:endoglucanase